MATRILAPLLSVEDFLEIDFGPDRKAELDNGVIRMMAGGTGAHARVQANIIRFLGAALRGTGCRPYGSDMGVRTHDIALRYPDVSVFCGRDTRENDRLRVFDDPRAVFEVLSESTAVHDQTVKLEEYKAIPSIDTIVYVDPDDERVRLLNRIGLNAWTDAWLDPGEAVLLPKLGVTMPWAEIFSRD